MPQCALLVAVVPALNISTFAHHTLLNLALCRASQEQDLNMVIYIFPSAEYNTEHMEDTQRACAELTWTCVKSTYSMS